jgi:hypothetical protein
MTRDTWKRLPAPDLAAAAVQRYAGPAYTGRTDH